VKNSGSTLLLLVALAFLVLLFTRSRRQQRKAVSVQEQIVPGAEVMTGSGLYGRVVELLDGQVVLEISPGVTSRWDRRAIVRVSAPAVAPDTGSGSRSDGGSDPAEPGSQARAEPDSEDRADPGGADRLPVQAPPDGGAPPGSV